MTDDERGLAGGGDNIEQSYPTLKKLFKTPFRDNESSERLFLQAFTEQFISSPHVVTTSVFIRQYPRSLQEMREISLEAGLTEFEIMDYAEGSEFIRRESGLFDFKPGSEIDPETRTYAVLGPVSWGMLRRGLNERMSPLYDIQERINQGKAVFVTEKAMIRLVANKRNGSGWAGH